MRTPNTMPLLVATPALVALHAQADPGKAEPMAVVLASACVADRALDIWMAGQLRAQKVWTAKGSNPKTRAAGAEEAWASSLLDKRVVATLKARKIAVGSQRIACLKTAA